MGETDQHSAINNPNSAIPIQQSGRSRRRRGFFRFGIRARVGGWFDGMAHNGFEVTRFSRDAEGIEMLAAFCGEGFACEESGCQFFNGNFHRIYIARRNDVYAVKAGKESGVFPF